VSQRRGSRVYQSWIRNDRFPSGFAAMHDRTAQFQACRPKLYGIAYRMLGSRADAEDMLQEAFLRWHRTDGGTVRSPEAWLTTAVTRLCIDRLRAARVERRAYFGPWLPEPLVGEESGQPDRASELASDLSVAFLLLLERLAPRERAAFLLHEVFDCGYGEIAPMLGVSEANCRQIVRRARQRVQRDRPRFEVSDSARRRLLETFHAALQAGASPPICWRSTATLGWLPVLTVGPEWPSPSKPTACGSWPATTWSTPTSCAALPGTWSAAVSYVTRRAVRTGTASPEGVAGALSRCGGHWRSLRLG
jgi:RNA polymerase sigma factor (sigma-70 family)